MSGVRTMDFDAVAASAPLNREASAVRDGSGETYDKRHPSFAQIQRWVAPPPLKDPRAFCGDGLTLHRLHTGKRMGRVVMLGVLDEPSATKNTKPKWVYRCDCNIYEAMRLKSLLASAEGMMCSACRETERLRQIAARPSTIKSRKAEAKRLAKLVREARP